MASAASLHEELTAACRGLREDERDGGSVFPASANTGDPTGPVEAYR